MISSDLGACEWFVWDLRRSNLIERGQLDQIIGDFLASQPGAEPHQLAEHLISLGFLTNFQAERLLQGKTQGFVLGPFTLLDALGTGSMGTVYKAQSKNDNRMYAVKVLPRRSMWNVRIARRKVRLFEQVRHPSVVPFIDVGTAGGMHYLAWPMVEGTSVEALVQERGKFTQSETLQLALQAAEGLDSANQAGVFHGLFKPSNLLIGQDGVLRILDYGIGCLLSETEGESLVDTMSTANAVNSGLDCASPESIMDPANLSPIGDQYSLGCVMYFCLTGQYPFPGGTAVEKMMSHQTKKPASIDSFSPGLSPEVIAMVEKLMSKNPADRYPAWQDVILALRNLLETVGSGSAQGTHRRQTMPMPRLNIPVKAAQSSSPSGELTALSPSAQGSSSAPPPTESVPEEPTASRPSSSGSMMTRPVPPLPARIPQPPGKSASGIPRPTVPL
ncbi:MAG: serine/threonine protein kinase, partial [Gemmataceae bacterium]